MCSGVRKPAQPLGGAAAARPDRLRFAAAGVTVVLWASAFVAIRSAAGISLQAGARGATLYAVPALTVVMSWGILGEVHRPAALAGGALCLAGVAISRRRQTPPTGKDRTSAPTGHGTQQVSVKPCRESPKQ